VAEHWVNAHLLRGQQKLAAGNPAAALADFQTTENIPDNLPSDRGAGRGREAELAWWTGLAHEKAGDTAKAKEAWERAVSATSERRGRRGGGGGISERSVQRYYQALAQQKLGATAEAETALKNLLEMANRALERTTDSDDSSEQFSDRQSPRRREALAHYVAGLALAGLGETDKARDELTRALQSSPDQLGAKAALAQLQ
jgi:tetratricopeptide (TPR) repeat protein